MGAVVFFFVTEFSAVAASDLDNLPLLDDFTLSYDDLRLRFFSSGVSSVVLGTIIECRFLRYGSKPTTTMITAKTTISTKRKPPRVADVMLRHPKTK